MPSERMRSAHLRRVLRLARRSRHYLRLDHVLRPGDGTSEEWDFCNGPCGVKSLSDCPVAEVLLLSGVGVKPPHHAIREDAVSPSKTRAPPREALTSLLTA